MRWRPRKFHRVARPFLLAVAVGLAAWTWRSWREPRYLGRPVSSWIRQAPYDNSSGSESDQALKFFGERAVPYLIDAMERPLKWQYGPLSRIPPRYLSRFLDMDQLRQVRRSAMWRLQELVRDESERGELQLAPEYPLTTRLLPLWKRELRLDPSGEILSGFESLGARMTNMSRELQELFPRLAPKQHEWTQAALMLSELHQPAVMDALLPFTALTNSEFTVRWSLIALGRNGITTERARTSIDTALNSTNANIRLAALQAAARLGANSPGILSALEQLKATSPSRTHEEILTIVEPVLLWHGARADPARIAHVEQNLSSDASAYVRLGTADILQGLGPSAQPFVPALERMARDPNRIFQVPAVRALRRIDATAAHRVLSDLRAIGPLEFRPPLGKPKK